MTSPLPILQAVPTAVGDILGAQLGVSIATGVVVTGAVVAALWIGRRLRNEAKRDLAGTPISPEGPSELTSRHVFRVLQERKIATVEEIAAMSPRERQLLFDSVARKVTPLVAMPAVAASSGHSSPAAAAAATVPATTAVGVLHCPVCAAPIAAAAEANRVVAPCPGCGRRLSARRDGVRVSVTVDDPRPTAAPGTTTSRGPSGGSPTTRARS